MRLRVPVFLAIVLMAFPFSAAAQQYLDMIEAGTFTLDEIRQEAEAHFDLVGRGRGTGYKQYKRWEYVASLELDESGVKIPNIELAQRARDFRRAERQRQAESGALLGNWKELGPTYWNATSGWNPGVGRVTSIGLDPTNKNHIIVGSPTGGVWKTLDGANTWTPLTDNYSTVDVFALEISPYNSNHYLWGSTSGRIYRSTDGGATWLTTGNVTGSGRVSRIQYHPVNPDIVYAVSESNGLFRSTNGGSTWSAVTGVSSMVGYDVEFKPGDPNTIYFSGRNVYRSTNAGSSWTQITGFGTASNNYKMMGVSPANPNVVYVLESNGGVFGAFYKSTNSGVSFTKLIDGSTINYFGYSATGDDDRGQAPRDMDVAVNPYNAEEVHIAGIHTWKSTNGGTSFSLTSHWVPSTAASLGVGYNHADIDILKFKGDTLFVGSDGGIYISLDGAKTFIDRTSGLGIREFYKIGVSKTNPNVVSGGSQDNGTSVMRGANRAWVDWLGADGMETFVDWNNANILYGTSQYGSMYRSTNQGTSRTSISKPSGVGDGAWVTPFEQDPQVANTIYVAFADVWKSTNSGSSWTKISNYDSGNMSQMKLAPSSNQRIYVSRGSSLFTTANGGTSWTTASTAWGSSSISYIAVHPQNPQRLLVVTSSNVYHSTNAGSSWTTIGSGLPSGTKYCATWENTGKNGIYVGGFGFVAYTNDDLGGQWVGFFEGLPNARVYELEINYVSNTIFAGTYGRGLWESPLFQASPPTAAFSADKRLGCRELTVAFTDQSANGPKTWDWTFEGGTPATSAEQNPVVTFSGTGSFTVRLKVTNDVGEDMREEADYVELLGPAVPAATDAERCEAGSATVAALSSNPDEQIRWYAEVSGGAPIFTGETFTTDIVQTTTWYATAGLDYLNSQRVGPVSNAIGGGGDHAGNFYLILDAQVPFRLKSATVYATGAKNRTFQLRNSSGAVVLEKSVFVPDGESRVVLDIDIPQGTDWQIGCGASTNLFRNNAGVNYPYTLPGVLQIKSSTAGNDYYYYLYDMEVQTEGVCESKRIAVTAVVQTPPEAPEIEALSASALCPGESVILSAANVCAGCTVLWSTGETGASIEVAAAGAYTAVVEATNSVCGDSPASNAVEVSLLALPDAPTIAPVGDAVLCPGGTVLLEADQVCAGCTVQWSNGAEGLSAAVSESGLFTATVGNTCGESPASNVVEITSGTVPETPTIVVSGDLALCPGEAVVLTAENLCSGCTVLWSNGSNEPSITVSEAGLFTAVVSEAGNVCGDSPASEAVSVTMGAAPAAPVVVASGPTSLCDHESVVLTVANGCADCTILWSNGSDEPSITVSEGGVFTAVVSNVCGDSPASNAMTVTTGTAPDAPVATALGTNILCPGAEVTLVAGNVCGTCTITWSNGMTGTSIAVSEPGAYTALVGNACGDSPISAAIAVEVGSLPDAPALAADGSTALCPGEAVTLSAENSCVGCTVLWSTGSSEASISVSETGTYTAIASNVCGDSPASEAIAVEVGSLPDAPVLSADGSTALCPGEAVTLSAENSCPGCTVLWSTGSSEPSISVSETGTYTAIASNVCGDSPASEVIAVEVGSLPDAPVLAADGSTTLCPGEAVTLSAENICAGCAVLWSTGSSEPSISVSETGTYTAIASNVCGDSPASAAIAVEVGSLPVAPILSADGKTALCPGASVLLVAEHPCADCTVFWSNGQSGQVLSVSEAGTYTATVSNVCGESAASNEIAVTVYPPFLPAINADNPCQMEAPAGSQYQWYVDGVAIPGATTQFWTALVNGAYSVTMNSPEGCPGSSDPILVAACASSVRDLANGLSARVYPNPAQDRIFLEMRSGSTGNARFDLLAADGRLIGTLYQGELLSGRQTVEITLPNVPAGSYRYRLTTERGTLDGNMVVLRP